MSEFTLRAVRFLERRLLKFVNMVKGRRGDVNKERGSASMFLAAISSKKESSLKNIPSDIYQLPYVAIYSLIAIWLTVAYRTGETARACLFIYPYLLIMLSNISLPMLRNLSIIAGPQTLFMQLFGYYYW